jgi:hypothetical protein
MRGDASAVPISICACIARARPGAAERSLTASNAHARVLPRGRAHARVPPRERRTIGAAAPDPAASNTGGRTPARGNAPKPPASAARNTHLWGLRATLPRGTAGPFAAESGLGAFAKCVWGTPKPVSGSRCGWGGRRRAGGRVRRDGNGEWRYGN